MKTSDVLRKAGDVLRERGHCKRDLADDSGRVCLMGAVNVALHGKAHYAVDGIGRAHEAAAAPIGHLYDAVAWNNAEATTVEEVLAHLDAAYVLALQLEGIDPEDVL